MNISSRVVRALLPVVLGASLACGARTGLGSSVDVSEPPACGPPWIVFAASVPTLANGRGLLPAAMRVDGSDRHLVDVLAPGEGLIALAATADRRNLLFASYDLGAHRFNRRITRHSFDDFTRTDVETGSYPSRFSESSSRALLAYHDGQTVRVFDTIGDVDDLLRDQIFPSRPAFDATEQNVIFAEVQGVGRGELDIVGVHGGPVRRLAAIESTSSAFALSPDKKRFALLLHCGDAEPSLRVGTLPTESAPLTVEELCGATTKVVSGTKLVDAAWGPEDWLVVVRDDRLVATRVGVAGTERTLTDRLEVHSPDVLDGCAKIPAGPPF